MKTRQNIARKRYIIAIVALIIIAICSGFSAYILIYGQRDIERIIQAKEGEIRAVAKTIEQYVTGKHKSRVKSFLNPQGSPDRAEMLEALAALDRSRLWQLSNPFRDLFVKEDDTFRSFGWFLKDNTVFLRMTKPELFGDDIS